MTEHDTDIAAAAPPKVKKSAKRRWPRPTREQIKAMERTYGHFVQLAREDANDTDLCAQLRAWIAVYWGKHDTGPTWLQCAQQLRPELFDDADARKLTGIRLLYLKPLMKTLRARGWVEWKEGGKKGSLWPGEGPKPVKAPHTKGGKPGKAGKPAKGARPAKPSVPVFSSKPNPNPATVKNQVRKRQP